MTFKKTINVGAMTLLASLAILIATTLWSHALSTRLLARVDMAHRQALLVTRLEADIVAREVADDTQRQMLNWAINDNIRHYLSTIANENALIDKDEESLGLQAREWHAARRLASVVRDRSGWMAARHLSHDIAMRERREAQEAGAAMTAVQSWISIVTWGVVLAIIVLYCVIGLLLWRGIVTPIAAIVEGTRRIAAEQTPTRVPLTGLGELRHLADRFNSMAGAIEEQVARRTEALHQANQRLKHVDARRRLFLSKVSHELRTPVTIMRGEAEVALRHPDDRPGLQDALTHILDSSVFLQHRLDDLLALARAEDGALPLASEPVDLADVVRQAQAMTLPFARSSGIDLQVAFAPDHVPILGDKERLCQALVAIIDNGVKFSPAHGAIIVRMDVHGSCAHIAISDEGLGVPDGELDRIFDPYIQTASGRSRGGTGLGLSLAQWIVRGHGGRISAANGNRGGGLCISMTLPVAS